MNTQVIHTLQALGLVFVLLMLVAAVHVVRSLSKEGVPEMRNPPIPPNQTKGISIEQCRERARALRSLGISSTKAHLKN